MVYFLKLDWDVESRVARLSAGVHVGDGSAGGGTELGVIEKGSEGQEESENTSLLVRGEAIEST